MLQFQILLHSVNNSQFLGQPG